MVMLRIRLYWSEYPIIISKVICTDGEETGIFDGESDNSMVEFGNVDGESIVLVICTLVGNVDVLEMKLGYKWK